MYLRLNSKMTPVSLKAQMAIDVIYHERTTYCIKPFLAERDPVVFPPREGKETRKIYINNCLADDCIKSGKNITLEPEYYSLTGRSAEANSLCEKEVIDPEVLIANNVMENYYNSVLNEEETTNDAPMLETRFNT